MGDHIEVSLELSSFEVFASELVEGELQVKVRSTFPRACYHYRSQGLIGHGRCQRRLRDRGHVRPTVLIWEQRRTSRERHPRLWEQNGSRRGSGTLSPWRLVELVEGRSRWISPASPGRDAPLLAAGNRDGGHRHVLAFPAGDRSPGPCPGGGGQVPVIRAIDNAAQRVRIRHGRRLTVVGRDGGLARQHNPRFDLRVWRDRWLFMRRPDNLSPGERASLEQMRALHPQVGVAY